MADGGILARRRVLRSGIIFLFGNGFWHPKLRGRIGEVVEVACPNEGVVWTRCGDEPVRLLPIPDFSCRAV